MYEDLNMTGLSEKMQKLSMLMMRLNRPAPMPHGPRGHAQERALNQIALRDGLTQTELMERLGVQRSSMSEMVDKLEHSGLIERRAGEEDRRQVNLFITENGRQHLERLNMEGIRFDPFSVLNEDERESMGIMLDRMIEYAQAECGKRGLPLHPPRPFPEGRPPFGMPKGPGFHGRPVPPPFHRPEDEGRFCFVDNDSEKV